MKNDQNENPNGQNCNPVSSIQHPVSVPNPFPSHSPAHSLTHSQLPASPLFLPDPEPWPEAVDGKALQKILRREVLGSYTTEKEAQEILELVELPDPKHITVI